MLIARTGVCTDDQQRFTRKANPGVAPQ
jgi:hypothetical protein